VVAGGVAGVSLASPVGPPEASARDVPRADSGLPV